MLALLGTGWSASTNSIRSGASAGRPGHDHETSAQPPAQEALETESKRGTGLSGSEHLYPPIARHIVVTPGDGKP